MTVRVLASCVPQTGHLTPLLPVLEALAADGAEVRVASGADVEPTVAARGLAFTEVCPSFDAWFGALAERTRGIPGDGLAPDRVESYFIPRLFGEVGLAQAVDGLVALAREWRPDLIVFDSLSFAGPMAAALVQARPVHHCFGALLDQDVLALANDAVTPVWREFGLPAPVSAGLYDATTLTVYPASLDPDVLQLSDARGVRVASVASSAASAASAASADDPRRLFEEPGRPLVYLTLGTFSSANPELFRLLVRALADEPVNVLVTVGPDNDPALLGPLPVNTRAERFIPQERLLPHCAAVVHHGGAGTMLGALAHGLPSVVLPQSADNFSNAQRLRAAGAGLVLPPDQVTEANVSAAVRSALDGPAARSASARIARELAAMPSPREVAAALLGAP